MSVKNIILNHIYKSLREEPEKWSFGTYEATNGNITIWMKNRYYATKFSMGSIEYDKNCPFWWLFPCEWWRPKLIKAVEEAQFKIEFSANDTQS